MIPIVSSTLVVGSLISAFSASSLNGKVIVIVLFVGSILSWSLMLTKWRQMRQAQLSNMQFLAAYRREKNPAAVFLKRLRYPASPLYLVYESTCKTLGAEIQARGADPNDLFMGSVGAPPQKLDARQLDAVQNAAESSGADQALALESQMSLLAIATSTAPLLGLLGTVWGVMDAFEAMADFGSAMLSAVAPGISGALLTTVVGLLVAMPSAIAYNLIADRIRHINTQLDNFVTELLSDIDRQYRP